MADSKLMKSMTSPCLGFKMDIERTYSTNFLVSDSSTFAPIPNTNEVVFWAKQDEKKSPQFCFISLKGGRSRKPQVGHCPHDNLKKHMVNRLIFPGVFLTCDHCDTIIRQKTGDVTSDVVPWVKGCIVEKRHEIRLHMPGHTFGAMAHGPTNIMFVASEVKGVLKILTLNTKTRPFTLMEEQTVNPPLPTCSGLAYIPPPFNLIVLSCSDPPTVRAISRDTKQLAWDQTQGVGRPHCMVYVPQSGVLLVLDGSTRVAVLNPGDGTLAQTITSALLGDIFQICKMDGDLIVRHADPGAKTQKVSCVKLIKEA